MVIVFSKNKRSQALFRRDPTVQPPPEIVFDGSISLADSPLEVTIPLVEASLLAQDLQYEILPDPDVEVLSAVVIDPFKCGDD